MALDSFEREHLQNFEMYLHPESLARRTNWPNWALDLSADTICGRTVLQRIHDYGCSRLCSTLVYLGTVYDKRRGQPIVPRQTRSTDIGGFYYHEPKRTTFVDDIEPAIMRAIINRHTIRDDRQKRLWSGWFPAYGRLWLMAHRDMIAPLPLGTQFVAVCDIANVDPTKIERPKNDGPEVFCYQELKPIMFVPVVSSDLSPYTIIIDEPGIDRARSEKIYQAARHDLAAARQQYKLVPLNGEKAWPIPLSK